MIKFTPDAPHPVTQPQKPFQLVSGQNSRMAGSVPVWDAMGSFAENIAVDGQSEGKDNSFGVADIIDMANPLQHIPIVNNFYRSMTGDTIGAIAQIVGGAIFGGPIGALTSAGMVAYQAARNSPDSTPIDAAQATKIDVADLRQGYKPYNN